MNFKSRLMPVRAIIFDLDGTLVDTERLHLEAFNSVLRPKGVKLTAADYFTRVVGYNDHDCIAMLLREHCMVPNETVVDELIAQKTGIYQRLVADRAVLFPGAREFVGQCAERFPLMLVTGSLRNEAELVL